LRLSSTDILRHREIGSVVIDEFRKAAVNTNSYDVTLGPNVARYVDPRRVVQGGVVDLRTIDPSNLFMLQKSDDGHLLRPGERVLAHTNEIAGGCMVACPACKATGRKARWFKCSKCWGEGRVAVTTDMAATSTAGRLGLSVCQCAGVGDVGFLDIWTLELQNHSPLPLFLPVGLTLGQVLFSRVTPPESGTTYDITGRYAQAPGRTPAMTRAEWTPIRMLPRRVKVYPPRHIAA
jgi:dCTP deaminase